MLFHFNFIEINDVLRLRSYKIYDKNVILNEDIADEEKHENLAADIVEVINIQNDDQLPKEENTETQNQSLRLSIADLIKNTNRKTKNK